MSFSAFTYYISNVYSYRDITVITIALSGFEEQNTELVIPEMLDDRKIISVDRYAFCGNTNLVGLDFSQATELSAIGESIY